MQVRFDLDDVESPEVEELVLDIAMQEARKLAAMLSDRLEAEGVENVQIGLIREEEGE